MTIYFFRAKIVNKEKCGIYIISRFYVKKRKQKGCSKNGRISLCKKRGTGKKD